MNRALKGVSCFLTALFGWIVLPYLALLFGEWVGLHHDLTWHLLLASIPAASWMALPILDPEARRDGENRPLLKGTLICLFGILLPLTWFIGGTVMIPDWKGAAEHGWIDCFHVGKLALSPFVLLATGSLYALDVMRVGRSRAIVGFGCAMGSIIAFVSLAAGLLVDWEWKWNAFLFFLVPVYTPFWYAWAAWRATRAGALDGPIFGLGTLASIPFWVWSVEWSRKLYDDLPDQPPSCYLVTAASVGHSRLVGRRYDIVRNGRRLRVNRQLLIFWEFERRWMVRFPMTHRVFRCVYNQIGPRLALLIHSPWIADAIYLAMKPVEWIARLAAGGSVSPPPQTLPPFGEGGDGRVPGRDRKGSVPRGGDPGDLPALW